MGPIDNMSAMVNFVAWHQSGDKPLPKTVMIQIPDAHLKTTIS